MINRILVCLLVGLFAAGCTSKGKKEADSASTSPARPKNFERAVPPVLLTDAQARAGYMITRYWDKFNFRDTMYCHAPEITEQAFSDFLSLFQYATRAKIVEGVNNLLDSCLVDVVMYNYFTQMAERYLYDPNSPMRNEEYFIPFLEHTLSSSRVKDESKIRPQQLLQMAYRNRIGMKAEDVVYTTASGSTGRLYNLSARYVLLMFHNPDCKECKQTTNEIKWSGVITSAVSSGRLKILAVYPDENLEIWRNHLNDVPASWINGYDKTLTVRNNQLYDLKAIPTLYLLDENKKVLLKDTSVGHIHDYLELNP